MFARSHSRKPWFRAPLSEQRLGGNGYVSFFAVTADRSVQTVTMISWEGHFTWASAARSI